ncbi:MaoC family dehydratase [Haloarcula nitratireducens]|uniref:MaoC family dehydratase n=1 Tax=Haloarcula nitratireducens TaxID=2487749 RepID=A0AAW4PIR1_9EURY|nr:MaoC family dehydratase [Halomicroarcula nitratireducens]MBX0297325.1 MaoC family dehydratase [Halomicroarcula nitratireducens]
MSDIYFEDIAEGTTRDVGSYTVSKEEMIAFSERYDPQPIHVDEEMASESTFGDIIASGWHTACLCMRLLVDEFLGEMASIGSPGLDELSWSTPVYAGDTLTVENEILDTRLSESRDDRGYVRNQTRAYNQDGDTVLSWIATTIVLRRDSN